jgi:SAM-dependent methyltransferase
MRRSSPAGRCTGTVEPGVARTAGGPQSGAVIHRFEGDAWEQHWRRALRDGTVDVPDPHVVEETRGLRPGTAIDVGCGTGADAVRLAEQGWTVTGVDVAPSALAAAAERGARAGVTVAWVEADVTVWSPATPFDLVTTAYTHAAVPQLELYRRLSGWVAPGGTLLVVAHASRGGHTADGHEPPPGSTVSPEEVAAQLEATGWRIRTAREDSTEVPGHPVRHHAVIVRAERPVA